MQWVEWMGMVHGHTCRGIENGSEDDMPDWEAS